MPVRVDDWRLPLLRISYIGDYSDDELTAYLATLDRIIARPGRKVVLFDLLRATVSPANQRKRQAEWISAKEDVLRRDFAAGAIVLDNALLRGAVTAVFWICPLPLPTQIMSTNESALTWLRPYLDGMYASSALR